MSKVSCSVKTGSQTITQFQRPKIYTQASSWPRGSSINFCAYLGYFSCGNIYLCVIDLDLPISHVKNFDIGGNSRQFLVFDHKKGAQFQIGSGLSFSYSRTEIILTRDQLSLYKERPKTTNFLASKAHTAFPSYSPYVRSFALQRHFSQFGHATPPQHTLHPNTHALCHHNK